MKEVLPGVIGLYVDVPCTSFRMPRAREFCETYLCPPPCTVFGMLLSLVGEDERCEHEGAEIAIAVLSEPCLSDVLRRVWRVKEKSKGPGNGKNVRPDYFQLLTGLKLAVWVRRGGRESAPLSLAERVNNAIRSPHSISRFGGLSLGESTHLVNDLRFLRAGDLCEGQLMVTNPRGEYVLPVWAEHVASRSSWETFLLVRGSVPLLPRQDMWISIQRPVVGLK